jgi:hypothetical protein
VFVVVVSVVVFVAVALPQLAPSNVNPIIVVAIIARRCVRILFEVVNKYP